MTSSSQSELAWRRARSCESGACVEIAAQGKGIAIRNSVDPDGPRITVSRAGWRELVVEIKDGAFDKL